MLQEDLMSLPEYRQERRLVTTVLCLAWATLFGALGSIQLAQIWQTLQHPGLRQLIIPELGSLMAMLVLGGAYIGRMQVGHALEQRHRLVGTPYYSWPKLLLLTAAMAVVFFVLSAHLHHIVSASHLSAVVAVFFLSGAITAWISRPRRAA